MKKLFLFFAAMLVAVAVNAATINVSPGVNTLKTAVATAEAGDVLELGDGIFYEEGNFDMKKNLTIKAAESAKPVIANRYYFRVEGGASIAFKGLKFDGASWRSGDSEPIGASDHCVRSYTNSTGEENVVFEDCEFTGYPSYILYTQRANRRWNSITIRNCYFYNNKRSAVAIINESGDNQSCNALTIENSTFANFAGSDNVINYAAPEAEHTTTLNVDHCTFYGFPKRAIYWEKSENLLVSNCIFSQSTANTYKSVECIGGTIKNCLSYFTAGYSSAATRTDNINEDPLFVDAENGNYTLGEGSPALTAAEDGGAIGDPRWVSAPSAPTSKTIYLNDGVWADAAAARYEVYCITNESWVTLTAVADKNNLYSAEIPETVTQVVYCRMDPTKPEGEWSSLQNQTEDLTIPDGKDLFTITGWGEGWGAKCNGVWSKYGEEYVPVLPNGFYLVGTFGGDEEWSLVDLNESKKFAATEVEGEYTLNYTLAKGDLFKAVYVENDAIKTWYPEGTGNDYLVTEWTAGEKTIYFRPTYHEAWGGHFYIEANKPEVTYSDFEIDLRAGQLGTDTENPNNAYLTISGEQYTYSQEMPLAYNAYLTSAKYNGNQHGYTNLVVTMPVEAGNYKVTLGTCQYGNGAGSIKKADDSETYKTFNQNIGEGKNYKTNPAEYIVSTVFSVAEAQMIKIVCGNYTPYIKVEQVANIEYAVTFAVEEGVRGIVPAPVAIVDGESLTIPANTTLYLEGHTLTGWTDGENTYAPGDVFTPEADATLTAVFAENTASLLTATVPVTVQWNFGLTEGAPTVAWEGENKGMGFLVAQATIGETKVDVPLDVDATETSPKAKFSNSGRNDYWAQVNAGTKLYFPAKKGAEVEVFTYADPATTTVDKATQTGTWTDNKSQFITTATIDASIMEVQENSYYRYLKVTYPASEATAISNTEIEVKAQKVIENGQIFILKNGVKYNVLGASVK